jgi:hypothetical protein
MTDARVHPWHRLNLTVADRHGLRVVQHRLAQQHPDVPLGRIIRMVFGTARLLRSADPPHEGLAEQVEEACRSALATDPSIGVSSG